MLKQIAYTGRILVTAFEKEPEQIVDALHQPLVTIDVFNKVQDIIEGRSRYKQKPKKTNPLFPLRGFLTCYQCGGNLTGSNSGNGRGGKFAYYHCNPKKGCNTRFKIKNVLCLPGVPSILKSMIGNLKKYLIKGKVVSEKNISLYTVESNIALQLEIIQKQYLKKDVTIGSYPFFRLGRVGVSVVLRSDNKQAVNSCYNEIKNMIKLKKIKIFK